MTTEAASFGAQLRSRRQASGLSQTELAERSGLSVRAISNLERGRTGSPYPVSVQRLADVMSLSAAERAEFAAAAGRRLGRGRAASDHAGLVSNAREAGSGPGERQPAPRQLPGRAWKFTGRQKELAVLTGPGDEAAPGPPAGAAISVIAGTAGVGKTTLAVYWAHQVAAQFPDGQLFVNLRGFDPSGSPVSPGEAARDFAVALGADPQRLPGSADGLTGLYRSLLAGRRVLVVLDNARDAAQVRPLLPGSPGCRVIITSRSRLTGLVAVDDAAQLTLAALDRGDARQLLARRLGSRRVAEDAVAARLIAESCGGLPLALCIAAARAATRPDLPLAQVAADLAAARDSLDRLAVRGDLAADVRAAFSWSYQTLPPASRRMFRLLGLHPGPEITAEAAASLAGVPRDEAALLLADLTESSLVSAAGGRFALHDLVRAYAAELAGTDDGEAGRHAARRRMLDHYLITAEAAAELLEKTRMPAEVPAPVPGVRPEEPATSTAALDWLSREYPVLLRLVELAAAARFDVHAWQLPRTLRSMFDWRARWSDWEHTHRLAAEAAVRLGDLRAQAMIHLSWAKCDINRGRWQEAQDHLQRAHDLFQELGDGPGQARALVNLGFALSVAGRYEQAAAYARRAHVLYTDLGDLDGQAGSLANLGLYQVHLGAVAAGRDLLVRAREVFTALGHRAGQAMAGTNIGIACQSLGDYRQAIACHREAVRLFAELGNSASQAEVLRELASAYSADGQPARAVQAARQALAILTEISHPGAASIRAMLAELEAGKSRQSA